MELAAGGQQHQVVGALPGIVPTAPAQPRSTVTWPLRRVCPGRVRGGRGVGLGSPGEGRPQRSFSATAPSSPEDGGAVEMV